LQQELCEPGDAVEGFLGRRVEEIVSVQRLQALLFSVDPKDRQRHSK
jgi:hypothetical protein